MRKLLILLTLLQIFDVAITLTIGTEYEVNPFARKLFAQQHGLLLIIALKAAGIAGYIFADYATRTRALAFARPGVIAGLRLGVVLYSALAVWNTYVAYGMFAGG